MTNKLKNVFLFFNGLSDDKAFYKTSVKSIKKIININFLLPVIFTNFIIKNYYLSGSTFIYFVSSRALRSDLGISLYSSSKTALPAFAKSMALEYGAVGMNFKIISLGLFNGGMENNLSESKKKSILDRSAIKEKVKISQLVSTIEFAIKDHAGNGSIIKCDNGYL
jgi:short-subunit dehydrogenase